MSSDLVLLERDNGVTTVALNRPDALNALSAALRVRIWEAFTELKDDPETEVIVLTGAGRAFTVGLDLKELGGEIPATADAATLAQRDLADAIIDVNKPGIGAVNGFAITGGFEIALMCDFLIASPEARFADTHARVGVVPGWGLSQRLPRLIGINRAKELSLTGNYLDAQTALAWGLVNRIVPGESLLAAARQLGRDILTTEPVTRAEIRRIMDAGWHDTLDAGLNLEKQASREHGRQQRPNEQVANRRASIFERGRDQTL